MFKELNLEDAKYLLDNFASYFKAFDYLYEDNGLKKYSINGLNKAYVKYIEKSVFTGNDDISIFVNTYNKIAEKPLALAMGDERQGLNI